MVGLGAAAIVTLVEPVKFRAEAAVVFQVDGARTLTDLSSGTNVLQSEASTYAQLATSPDILAQVRSEVGRSMSEATLRSMISATSATTSPVITISVSSTSQTVVAPVANAVARELGRQVAARTRVNGGARVSASNLAIAYTPLQPDQPVLWTNLLVGLLTGLLLGFIATNFIRPDRLVEVPAQTADRPDAR